MTVTSFSLSPEGGEGRGEGKLAFLFPGQGARNVLEAIHRHRDSGPGQSLLETARRVTGLTWAELDAQAGRALERTEVLQPLLTACALVVHQRLVDGGLCPDVVLGHSLGEVAAVSAAGAMSADEAVELAAVRGRLMAREAQKHPGGLVAVSSLAEAKRFPALELSAVNAPDEVVLGGPESSLPKGARRIPVSGPWHTKAMAGAVDEFRAALRDVARPLRVPLVRNLDGAAVHDAASLGDQLVSPVHFVLVMKTLLERGIDTVVTVGPGLVLRGLVRRNAPGLRVLTTEDDADVERVLAYAAGRARQSLA